MTIAVLDTFEVNGVPVTAPQERLVLLALVACRPDSMSRGRLTDYLDGGVGLSSRVDRLSPVISRLRKKLGDGVLVRDGSGRYRLALGSDEPDLDLFMRRCVEYATVRGPLDRLAFIDATLAMCPKEPWSEFADLLASDSDYLGPLAQTVARQRVALTVERASALLALGRIVEAQGVEHDLAASPELLDSPPAVMVVAEVRWASGRHADALAAIADHQRLRSERGLGIAESLQAIEGRILSGEEWTLPVPETAATDSPSLRGDGDVSAPREQVSRERRSGVRWAGRLKPMWRAVGQWGTVRDTVNSLTVAAPRSTMAVGVSGARGMGKSRFLDVLDGHLRMAGFTVGSVRCVADNPVPLAPIDWLLEELVLADGARSDRVGALPPSEGGDGSAAARAIRAAGSLLESTRSGPTALLVDDLDLADPATLATVDVLLARRTPAHPLCLVFTFDPARLPGTPESARGLEFLVNAGRTLRAPLAPLGEREVLVLASELLGDSFDVADSLDLVAVSGGVPQKVIAILRHLADAGLLLVDGSGVHIVDGALWTDAVTGLLSRIAGGASDHSSDSGLAEDSSRGSSFALDGEGRDLRRAVELCSGWVGEGPLDTAWAATAAHVTRLCCRVSGIGDLVSAHEREILIPVLRQGAQLLEASGSWVSAARAWECLCVLDRGAGVAEYRAGRSWMRAHDGRRAVEYLSGASRREDPEVAGAAMVDLCRTRASLAVDPGRASFDHEADDWIGRHPDRPTEAGRLEGVLAEWAAVMNRPDEATVRLRRARSLSARGADPAALAEVEFSSGVVDMMLARPRRAVAGFRAALAGDDGNEWLSAWCEARHLMCRSVTAPSEVTPAEVVRAKSVALAVQSWSDVELCCVSAAQVALLQGDRRWAAAELEEAGETDRRASYPLAGEPLRMLWTFLATEFEPPGGLVVGSPQGWFAHLWSVWCRLAADRGNDGAYRRDAGLSVEIRESLERVSRQAEVRGLHLLSGSAVVVSADIAARAGWADLSRALLPSLDEMTRRGFRCAMGVPVPLSEVVDRVRRSLDP